jgi:RNA-directed DNA polymerase
MKRIGNLKRIWCNLETLIKAFREVKKGKNYDSDVLEYEQNLIPNLIRLLERLENGSYTPKPPKVFTILEPKERIIEAPALEDRIVHHSLLIATKQYIENRFINNSFACRKNKGTHKASNSLLSGMRANPKGYYLKMDIKKFFYSIDQSSITDLLSRIIKCQPTLELYKKFYINDSGKGLPLGNVTSQVLANLALNPVDHYIKRALKCKYYYRYMDDMVILSNSKTDLQLYLINIKNILQGLKLSLNTKTKIDKISNGIDFVGYRTWINRRVIRKRSLYSIRKKLKINTTIQRVSSFLAHSKNTDSLKYVITIILFVAPNMKYYVQKWLINNRGEYAIL